MFQQYFLLVQTQFPNLNKSKKEIGKMDEDRKKDTASHFKIDRVGLSIAFGAGIGVAIGAGFGVAMGNIAIGAGIGVALGSGLGMLFGMRKR